MYIYQRILKVVIFSSTPDLKIDTKKKCVLIPKSAYYDYLEGSCGTQYWSNGCWEFNKIKKNKKII